MVRHFKKMLLKYYKVIIYCLLLVFILLVQHHCLEDWHHCNLILRYTLVLSQLGKDFILLLKTLALVPKGTFLKKNYFVCHPVSCMSEEKTNTIECLIHLHIYAPSLLSLRRQLFNRKFPPLWANDK